MTPFWRPRKGTVCIFWLELALRKPQQKQKATFFSSARYILFQTFVFFQAPLIYFTLNQKIATLTWLLIFWNYYLISSFKITEKLHTLLTRTLLSFKLKFWHDHGLRKEHVLHSFICVCWGSCLHHRTWRKIMFELGESTGKLGLKMTNRTHTNESKMVWLSYFVPGYVISNTNYIYQSEKVRMVSKHWRSCTVLWLLRRGGATTHDFLGAQQKM